MDSIDNNLTSLVFYLKKNNLVHKIILRTKHLSLLNNSFKICSNAILWVNIGAYWQHRIIRPRIADGLTHQWDIWNHSEDTLNVKRASIGLKLCFIAFTFN